MTVGQGSDRVAAGSARALERWLGADSAEWGWPKGSPTKMDSDPACGPPTPIGDPDFANPPALLISVFCS